jgi:hypothetical protein
VVSFEDVRAVAISLPRTIERVVYGRIKFRVGAIVYVGMSADETTMGFAFPKEERADLVASRPDTFFLPPRVSDLRFQWVCTWLAALDEDELEELVVDAWRMVVPKRVAAEHLATLDIPGRMPRSSGAGDRTQRSLQRRPAAVPLACGPTSGIDGLRELSP